MKIISKSKNRVVIDGREFSGRNVCIDGDQVWVDGERQDGSLIDTVNITVHGPVEKIELSRGKVVVMEGANAISTQSGDVECGNVGGSVSTMSGDVHCGKVSGNVSTMSGDINKG